MAAGHVIRDVLIRYGRLQVEAGALTPSLDLYAAGLTSHTVVSVMIGLEDAFDLEFPDELLRRETFRSVAAIEEAVASLQPALP